MDRRLLFQLVAFIGLALLQFQVVEIQGSKILALYMVSSRSIRNILDSLTEELAKRGHEITVLSTVASNSTTKIRYIHGKFDVKESVGEMPNIFQQRINDKRFFNPFSFIEYFEGGCRALYESAEVEELRNEAFDLVLVSVLLNECAYGLASNFNAPTIGISPQSSVAWTSRAIGAPVPPSFVPIFLGGHSHSMTFWERIDNFYMYVWSYAWREFYYNPRIEKMYREYFPDAPSISEYETQRLDLILMNSHPVLNYPRPLLPNMIEVGGIHCKKAKPLNKELEDFIIGSGDAGFIYFSMGSIVPESSMPDEYRLTILNTFSKLKQRVIWKWETETMENLPANVKLSKWLPQQDILGHPKIRLFITHGGLLSTEEAVFHGVPVIGIPMFSDQDLNMKQAEMAGFALKLEFGEITGDVLHDKIKKILDDSKYTKRVKELSRIFREGLDSPLERAVYWAEYKLRHPNSSELRSAGRDLNFIQYHSIDVILTLLFLCLFTLYSLFRILKFIAAKAFYKKHTPKIPKLKKN